MTTNSQSDGGPLNDPDERQTLLADYDGLTRGAGLVSLGAPDVVRMSGADRAKFLHNLCTNNIKALQVGQGCEAMVLDAQGRVLDLIEVYCREETLEVHAAAGREEALLKHLDRYLIREQVELQGVGQEQRQLLVAGARAAGLLETAGATLPRGRMEHAATMLFGYPVWIRQTPLVRENGWIVVASQEDTPAITRQLLDHGVVNCGRDVVETLRIEQGLPATGLETGAKTLPQELARDALAISFTKGCYLGQETVARIDALGHVNRLLVGLACDAAATVSRDMPIKLADREIGQVTSVCWSPKLERPLALGYVKRGHEQPGAVVQIDGREAKVVALPLT